MVLPDLVATAPEPVKPDHWIEGMRLPTEFVARKKIGMGQYITREEILERYLGMSTVPAEYLQATDRAQCGMIVVWTRVPRRNGPAPERPRG